MSRIAGLTHKEIAERLGKSEESSRALLRRALLMLAWVLRGVESDA